MDRIPIATWNPERDLWETSQVEIFGHSVAWLETWPKSGMTRRGQLFELPTSVPPTTGHGCSSSHGHRKFPAPKAGDGIMGRPRTTGRPIEKSTHLGTIVTLLPTPRTTDSHGPGRHGTGGQDLRTVVAETLTGAPTAPRFDDGND